MQTTPTKPKKDAEIKARVDGHTKTELWRLAYARDLDESDLLREAVRDLFTKYQPAPHLASR